MRANLDEQLTKAIKEKSVNDEINYPKKVRALVMEYFKKFDTDSIPEFKEGNHKISFYKCEDSIFARIDGQVFSGSVMDAKINEISLVGEKFEKNRKQIERKKEIKGKAKNIGRITKIDLTRKALAAPAAMNNEGQGIIMNLLRLLGRTLSKSVQNR